MLGISHVLSISLFISILSPVDLASFQEVESYVRLVNSANLSVPALITYIDRISTRGSAQQCLEDLQEVLNGTLELQPWALSMISSGTKVPIGFLEENQRDLGRFDQCVEVERGRFIGQHCLITLVLGLDLSTSVRSDEDSYVVAKANSIAACVPSTCETPVLKQAFNLGFFEVNGVLQRENLRLDAYVHDVDCHTRRKTRLGIADWIVLVLLVILVALGVAGTVLQARTKRSSGLRPSVTTNFVQHFCLIGSCKKLFAMNKESDDFKTLYAIKFLSVAWVVLSHKYFFSTTIQPVMNPYRRRQMFTEWTKMIVINGSLAVESFFFIAGLLNAYCFFTLIQRKKGYTFKDLLRSYSFRYLRISIPYFLIIALTATLIYHLGSGPLWGRVVGDARRACRDHWWTNVIYVNNYLTPEGSCVIQSWFLAVEMQLFWLAPFILIPMWKWANYGNLLVGVLLILSWTAPFIISFMYEIRTPIPFNHSQIINNRQMKVLYLPTHARTLVYICGIVLGNVLHRYRMERFDFKPTKVKIVVGWTIAAGCLLYSVFGCFWYFQPEIDLGQLSSSFYLAFYKLLWCIGLGWLIFVCEAGQGGLIGKLLCSRFWQPLGRLSFSIFLIHGAFLTVRTGLVRTEFYIRDFNLVEEYLGDLVIIMLLSTLLYVFVESPFTCFCREMIRRESTTEDKDQDDTDNEDPSFSTRIRLNFFKSTS